MKIRIKTTVLLVGVVIAASVPLVHGLDRAKLDREAANALRSLTASDSSARLLADNARVVLVFPRIVKAGFMFGGQTGNGVLMRKGTPVGYYNSVAASYGLQVGLQTFGYALFFMNDQAISYLEKSDGWEIGAGPSIVVVDKGVGKSLTSTTLTQDVYAFIFDQKGLMGGIGIQGSKITKLSD